MEVIGAGHLVAGRYRLLGQIAGGGMGTVWRAHDELLGRTVAVKQVVPPPGADQELVDQQRQRALREGRIAARLSHPHAISVYDVATDGGQPWLVMEYLPSRSLAQVLHEDGPLGPEPVAQIGAQVADALAATHAAGIVHRDVKPANVLVGRGGDVEGLVKITDFGISHASGDVTLTQTGQITGTPAFLAPEVAQGAEMSEASDVFSLGATLYTCLEGEPPFGMDDNALRLLHRVAGGGARPPSRAGSLSAPLVAMLADDPAARPTMPQVRDRLARLAAGRDGDPTTVLLARTDLRPAPGRARTESLPAGGAPVTPPVPAPASPTPPPPAAAPDPSPAPAPAPAPGPESRRDTEPAGPPRPPDTPRPGLPRVVPTRRRRLPLLLAGLVLLLLVGGGVAWLAATSGGDGDDAAGPSTSAPAPSSSADPTAETPATGSTGAGSTGAEPSPPEEGSPSTDEPPPTAQPPAADADVEVRETLGRYYDLLPRDTEAAYAMTGPSLRAQVSYDSYAGFFGTWSEVGLLDVRDVTVDGDRVTATTEVRFTRPGEQQVETHAVTFVRGGDGGLLVDLDVAA
ncbi:serine/threonine-protein kinase [Blastococcus sp. SYSU D00695]